MQLSLFQKILSFLYPVRIRSASGLTTPILSLYRFQGRWQLSAATALYSDGASYRPLTTAFHYLKTELAGKNKMLVLGAGLGSAVDILQKMKVPVPHSTLVDIDPQVIAWGKEIANGHDLCNWVTADAQAFVRVHDKQYDLLVIDLFQDRIVPQFVTQNPFLEQCKQLLTPGRHSVAVLNYIINNETGWKEAQKEIEAVFKVEHVITIGINRIYILRNNA